MPSALYAVTHATTRKVLALASFERKTKLTDQDAWKTLRGDLVGEKLTIDIGTTTHGPVELLASELAVDEINVEGIDPRMYYDHPYTFELEQSGATAAVPGDGTLKKLSTPADTLTITLRASGTLDVELSSPPPSGLVTATIVFEGGAPQNKTINGANFTKKATFAIAAPVTVGHEYVVLVMVTGAPVEARRIVAVA